MKASMQFFDFISGALRSLPAEFAHDLGVYFLKNKWHRLLPEVQLSQFFAQLRMDVPGLGSLNHPLALAAGFDKNGVCYEALAALGFSAVEVGTVTLNPQNGNPKPRMFRLKDQQAIINRMGFNNLGHRSLLARLDQNRLWQERSVPIGVNIGRGKNTENQYALKEYLEMVRVFMDHCQYMVLNISSPNTPNLRELAKPSFLVSIAEQLSETQKLKLWLKFDPDLNKPEFQGLIEAAAKQGFGGVILTNTHRVNFPHSGGLSGHPVLSMSNKFLEDAWEVHQGALPMIGVGGVFSGVDVLEKVLRGASLVQIYSSFVYRGPFVVLKILTELKNELDLRGIEKLSDVLGAHYSTKSAV